MVPTPPLRLSQLVRRGEDLTIRKGQSVTIDGNARLGLLRIEGTLRCPDDRKAYRIEASGILVSGTLECGTKAKPFAGRLQLVLLPGVPLMRMGPRSIAVVKPGVLRLHGQRRNAGWVKLAQNAAAGTQHIVLTHRVSWRTGERIAVGPTGYNPLEAEEQVIDRVEGKTVYLRQALRFPHHGRVQRLTVGAKARLLDQRAEVANLSRNIQIFPSGPSSSHNRLGAHLMVMRGAKAYVDSVEFIHMGRMGEMARYPFHWHRAGDVNGQYIINSSVHHSYQRCVTVHGSNRALVKNNVCFDHFGHGYFLEDGDEVKNRIEGNLGMLSRRVPKDRALLISDAVGSALRFSAPATYWISNPDNYIVGNVASGSQGTGFWHSLQKGLFCNQMQCVVNTKNPNVRPAQTNTWAFRNNVAHATDVGFTWDGAPDGALRNNPRNPNDRELVISHYRPRQVPRFDKLVGFKNVHTGVYFRGRTAVFCDNLYADNGWSLFFTHNQVDENSAVVGQSEAVTVRDLDYLQRRNKRAGQRGIVLYDGPFELNNVDFIDFPQRPVFHAGVDVTAVPFGYIGGFNHFTNVVKGLRFSPEPSTRVAGRFENAIWLDNPWSNSLRDIDGSLSGRVNALLVGNHPINNFRGCQPRRAWNALLCNYRVRLLIAVTDSAHRIPFRIIRSDGPASLASADDAVGKRNNKFNMILDQGLEYTVEFATSYQRPSNFRIRFQAERLDQLSPVLRMKDLGRNCRLGGASRVASRAALRSTQRAAYYSRGDSFYFRIRADQRNDNVVSRLAKSAQSVSCASTATRATGNNLRLRFGRTAPCGTSFRERQTNLFTIKTNPVAHDVRLTIGLFVAPSAIFDHPAANVQIEIRRQPLERTEGHLRCLAEHRHVNVRSREVLARGIAVFLNRHDVLAIGDRLLADTRPRGGAARNIGDAMLWGT